MAVQPLNNRISLYASELNAENKTPNHPPNNRVQICWPFALKENQTTEALQQQLENLALDQLTGNKKSIEQQSTWVWQTNAPISDEDLFPRFKAILQNQTRQTANKTSSFFPCQLTPEITPWLNNGMGKNPLGERQYLGLQVTNKSLPAYLFPETLNEKLQQQTCFITFNISNAYLYLTRLNVGVIVMEVQYQQVLRVNQQGIAEETRPVTANDIQEANYRLYRNNKQSPRIVGIAQFTAPPAAKSPKDQRQQQILQQLSTMGVNIDHNTLSKNTGQTVTMPYPLENHQHLSLLNQFLPLLGDQIHSIITIDEQRALTFTQLLLATSPAPETMHKLGYQIAKKESYRYSVSSQAVNASHLEDHQDIVHYQTHQGGCIIIVPNNQQQTNQAFLKHYIAHSGTFVYLTIVVMVLIEKHFLEQLSQDEYLDVQTVDYEQLQNQLAKRLRKLLDFRTNYRLTNISYLSNHNKVYQRWRDIMQLNTLLQEHSTDIKDSHELIHLENEKQVKRKLKKLESFGVIATAFIFLFGMFGMNIVEITKSKTGLSLNPLQMNWEWQHFVSAVTLLIAGIFVWLIHKNNK